MEKDLPPLSSLGRQCRGQQGPCGCLSCPVGLVRRLSLPSRPTPERMVSQGRRKKKKFNNGRKAPNDLLLWEVRGDTSRQRFVFLPFGPVTSLPQRTHLPPFFFLSVNGVSPSAPENLPVGKPTRPLASQSWGWIGEPGVWGNRAGAPPGRQGRPIDKPVSFQAPAYTS